MRTPKPESVAVGRTIRRLRGEAGLTMSELAGQAGLSQPYLSQLEKGTATPSIVTLYALSDVLHIHPGDLLEVRHPGRGVEVADSDILITAPSQRQLLTVAEHASFPAEALIPGGSGAKLEAYLHAFDPADPDRNWFEHDGEDFIYVLSGTVELQLEGRAPVTIETGYSAYHSGLIPHRCRAVGDDTARLLLVSHRDHPAH